MMEAAEAYAAGLYADEPVSFSTEEDRCCTMNDFCAGWRNADRCSRWIPVEEKRPPFDWKDDGTWSSSLPILIYSIHGISIGTFQLDHVSGKSYWFFDGSKHEEFADGYRLITHWMPLPAEPQGKETSDV